MPSRCTSYQPDAVYLMQIYEHGRGLAFHFDKDEHLLSSKGQMVHPMVNSIVYLTGDSATSRLGALMLMLLSLPSLAHGCPS